MSISISTLHCNFNPAEGLETTVTKERALAEYDKAEGYKHQGEPSKAKGCYEKSLQQWNTLHAGKSDDIEILYHRMVVLYALGRYQEALADCEKALESDPENFAFLYQRTFILNALGCYQESLERCEQAMDVYAENIDLICQQIHNLNILKRYTQALDVCRGALMIFSDSEHSYPFKELALTLTGLENYQEAWSACETGLELYPEDQDLIQLQIAIKATLRANEDCKERQGSL
jgi:tetratricopeptide (TPR) repeat protein